ncbi:MAG: four-helix bundle copper-binding protein [Deltaproteobacteria bacterium]|nr:four-helix bundle copper-binding protein [Deltaproteobacteria bacterium]
MMKTMPQKPFAARDALVDCIRACSICQQACVACADACMGEKAIDRLKRCIRLNLDCADICVATERVLSRQEAPDLSLLRHQVESLALACRVCADECAHHKDAYAHCKVCMDACKACEQSCNDLLGSAGFAQAGVH